MKLHADRPAGHYIRSFEPGRLRLADRDLTTASIIAPDQVIEGWQPLDPQALTLDDLAPALALDPELVIIGTGLTQRFVSTAVAAQVMRRGIGLECMATEAACRTYNILMAEDRRVVAALLLR
jgi:uncharacterized protein